MERKSTYRLVIQENSKAFVELVKPEGETVRLNEFEDAEAGQAFLDQAAFELESEGFVIERINPFQLEVIATEKLPQD